MQNQIKTETRLAFIQFIFSTFFSEISIEENSKDFEEYFNKLSVSSIDQIKESLINFNKNYFTKLVSTYNNFITDYNISSIINPLLSFERKFESWDRINKSIILSIFSELQEFSRKRINDILRMNVLQKAAKCLYLIKYP